MTWQSRVKLVDFCDGYVRRPPEAGMRVFGPSAPPDPCIPRPQYACGTTHGGQQAGTAPAICSRNPATISVMTRTYFFSPKAWMRGEMAHCSYYKNYDVTKDVARLSG